MYEGAPKGFDAGNAVPNGLDDFAVASILGGANGLKGAGVEDPKVEEVDIALEENGFEPEADVAGLDTDPVPENALVFSPSEESAKRTCLLT